jgi:hypothetical protein
MSGKSVFISLFFTAILFYASCGGPPSYTAPIVTGGNVVQSECNVPEEGTVLEEKVEVRSVEGEVVIVHSNILLPENTLVGIIDIDGYITYERVTGYYYLEAGEQFINVREKFKLSSSPDNCYYDMTIRISNVSGGTYHLTLFGNDGVKIHSSEVRVR